MRTLCTVALNRTCYFEPERSFFSTFSPLQKLGDRWSHTTKQQIIFRVSTTPGNTGNTGNLLEFEIPPGNTGNLLDFC